MAAPLKSVETSGIPIVTKDQFYKSMAPGDLVFTWGSDAFISKGIEVSTGQGEFSFPEKDGFEGPSHVMKVWLPWSTAPWLTLEAEIGHGVRVGPFADYADCYPGAIVLCRRPLTYEQVQLELQFGFSLLDYKYDTVEFASIIARKLSNKFPLIQPPNQLYCSGLQQALATKSIPFHVPDKPWATPQQLFTESSVQTVCAMLEK